MTIFNTRAENKDKKWWRRSLFRSSYLYTPAAAQSGNDHFLNITQKRREEKDCDRYIYKATWTWIGYYYCSYFLVVQSYRSSSSSSISTSDCSSTISLLSALLSIPIDNSAYSVYLSLHSIFLFLFLSLLPLSYLSIFQFFNLLTVLLLAIRTHFWYLYITKIFIVIIYVCNVTRTVLQNKIFIRLISLK